jgi:hypothetical protein
MGNPELAFSVRDIIYSLQKMLSHMRYIRVHTPPNLSLCRASEWLQVACSQVMAGE